MAFGRRSNAQPALSILMQDAGALVGEMLETDFSGVAVVQRAGSLLLSVAGTSGPVPGSSFPMTCEYSLDAANSLAAFALSTAAPVVTVNLAAEKRFCDLFLRKLRVISALCVPLHLAKKGLGTLGVYSTAVREFSVGDAHFVETISHLLASSIGRLRVEEELWQKTAMASLVLDTIDRLLLTLDASGVVLTSNQTCHRVSGRNANETHGKPFWDVFAVPEETEVLRRILQSSLSDARPFQFESLLLAKSGDRRPIVWSLKPMREMGEHGARLLLIGAERAESPGQDRRLERSSQSAQSGLQAGQDDASTSKQGSRDIPARQAVADLNAAVADAADHPFALVGGKVKKELRRSPRRRFLYRQLIAPVIGDRLPLKEQFFPVQCQDISAGGIAFLLDRSPDFHDLVVALGQPSQPTYFAARVVRVQAHQERARQCYLVGCRFTGRIVL